jgi:hypothetical protein
LYYVNTSLLSYFIFIIWSHSSQFCVRRYFTGLNLARWI